MNGPYPIYGSEDENDQNFPMPGDNPVPQFESIEYDNICRRCEGEGGWYDSPDDDAEWIRCVECDGSGWV